MILFDKLWQTMQERGITQYDLYTKYNMNEKSNPPAMLGRIE